MLFVRHDIEPDSANQEMALEFRKRYKLDISSQEILSLTDGKRYKLSGNAFSSDIAAMLIGDSDFQPDYTNLGVIFKGKRFYCFAIDKEHASFDGYNYEVMYKNAKESNIVQDALYSSRTPDQIMYILYRLNQALTEKDIDKIFKNKRVLSTKFLEDNYDTECENFKKSAISMLEHYTKEYGENYLAEFAKRENIRAAIVEKVISKLNLNTHAKDVLMEDLRAPYYQRFFVNKKQISQLDADNEMLFNEILADVAQEFNKLHLIDKKSSIKMK